MKRSLVVFAFLLALLGCGSQSSTAPAASSTTNLSVLPATVEGTLTIDLDEGDVGDDGVSDFNFGTLVVGQDELMVEIDGNVLRSVKVPEEGVRVRAELGSKSDQYGMTSYKVTKLSRL